MLGFKVYLEKKNGTNILRIAPAFLSGDFSEEILLEIQDNRKTVTYTLSNGKRMLEELRLTLSPPNPEEALRIKNDESIKIIEVKGEKDLTVVIEFSTDLKIWQEAAREMLPYTGIARIAVTNNEPVVSYRARYE